MRRLLPQLTQRSPPSAAPLTEGISRRKGRLIGFWRLYILDIRSRLSDLCSSHICCFFFARLMARGLPHTVTELPRAAKRLLNQPSLIDIRLRCCCHVPHSCPKQTKNSAQRPFDRGHFQRLSSRTRRALPPQCIHSAPVFIQKMLSHAFTTLAVLSVRFIPKCLPHD
ncbi:hypothetical protein JOB18_010189 [Solea senegalensis]|uniref:Uncharacterized protein n=1 Tax=Solea senegalensis TaxID=28829 RepID=A0AAV6QGR5_SOLSE|nr:hypothetical protein JOB18_010189 [Solea senegalensis]